LHHFLLPIRTILNHAADARLASAPQPLTSINEEEASK
jgi:hypothetical protein